MASRHLDTKIFVLRITLSSGNTGQTPGDTGGLWVSVVCVTDLRPQGILCVAPVICNQAGDPVTPVNIYGGRQRVIGKVRSAIK